MKFCVLRIKRIKFRKKLKKKARDQQRGEMNLIAKNAELSQLVIEYQQKVCGSSDSLQAAEELSRKLTEEVSTLKHEKELLLNSEKRARDEVCSLSNLQRDLVQVKKELQERDLTINNAMRQVEDLGKQLADALHAVVSAESRAAVAESHCFDLESKFKASQDEDWNQDLFPDLSEMFTTDKIFENRASLSDWVKDTGRKCGTELAIYKSDKVGGKSARLYFRCKQHTNRKCHFEVRGTSKPDSNEKWTVKVHSGRHNHCRHCS